MADVGVVDAAPSALAIRSAAMATRAAVSAMKAAGAAARAAGELVASATIVAAAHAAASAADLLDQLDSEVLIRLAAIAPELSAGVDAGARGCPPSHDGNRKAARNVASHWRLGAGPDALRGALAHPKRAQRGRRRVDVLYPLLGDSSRGTLSSDSEELKSGHSSMALAVLDDRVSCLERKFEHFEHNMEPDGLSLWLAGDGTSPWPPVSYLAGDGDQQQGGKEKQDDDLLAQCGGEADAAAGLVAAAHSSFPLQSVREFVAEGSFKEDVQLLEQLALACNLPQGQLEEQQSSVGDVGLPQVFAASLVEEQQAVVKESLSDGLSLPLAGCGQAVAGLARPTDYNANPLLKDEFLVGLPQVVGDSLVASQQAVVKDFNSVAQVESFNMSATQRLAMDVAMDVVAAAARRLPKIKVKFKALMKLAAGACIRVEVRVGFSSTLLASDDDEDVFDLVMDWCKAVEFFLASKLNCHVRNGDDKFAVLMGCFRSVLCLDSEAER